MGRRKKEASGCGWGLAVLVIISIAGPLAPLIALGLGIGGIFYVIKWLASQSTTPMQSYRPVQVSLPYEFTAYAEDVRAIQKKLQKPGRWKTQVDRISDAAKLMSRINKSAASARAHSAQYAELVNSLNASINWAVQQATPAINRHYIEQTEKLQEMTSPVRVAKSGQALLDQLAEVAGVGPWFHNLTETLALPVRQMVTTAQQTNTYKTRITTAKKAERSGDREGALTEYLDLLYELKTDNIDDDEQANEIAELEDYVRKVVRTYATPVKGKRMQSARTHTRRLPNS